MTVTISHCGNIRAADPVSTKSVQSSGEEMKTKKEKSLTKGVVYNLSCIDIMSVYGTEKNKTRNLKQTNLQGICRANFHR
jgi:hypothetical protein